MHRNRPTKRTAWVLLAALLTVLFACNPTPTVNNSVKVVEVPSDRDPDPMNKSLDEEGEPGMVRGEDAGAPVVIPFPGTERFGCHAFEPIKSQDPCAQATDCAPSTLCHAPACIAASRAPTPHPGVQCTMNLVCKTIDVGRCDCVDGFCALVSY